MVSFESRVSIEILSRTSLRELSHRRSDSGLNLSSKFKLSQITVLITWCSGKTRINKSAKNMNDFVSVGDVQAKR